MFGLRVLVQSVVVVVEFDANGSVVVFDVVLGKFVVYPVIVVDVVVGQFFVVVVVAAVERVLVGIVAVVVVELAVAVTRSHSDPGLPGRVIRQHPAPAGPYAECETLVNLVTACGAECCSEYGVRCETMLLWLLGGKGDTWAEGFCKWKCSGGWRVSKRDLKIGSGRGC